LTLASWPLAVQRPKGEPSETYGYFLIKVRSDVKIIINADLGKSYILIVIATDQNQKVLN
jgi:hypothetical protein